MTKTLTDRRRCELCGKPIRSDNKYGLCERTADCLAERRRLEYANRAPESIEKSRQQSRELWKQKQADQEPVSEITYLLWSPLLGLYKIGHTVNLKARLATLRGGLHTYIYPLATYPAGRTLESFLHEVFGDLREGNSEWFRLPVEPELAAATIWEFARVYWESKGEIPPENFSRFSPTGELAA